MATTTQHHDIAFLGTGIMGAPMARHLLQAGHRLRIWNRTATKAAPLADLGGEICESAAAAVAGCDVIITMLSDGPATEAVMLGAGGVLAACRAGQHWLQMATVGVTATEGFAAAAAAAGLPYVDAPVLGTKGPAEAGELVVLAAGGGEGERALCEGVFAAFSRKQLWLPRVGDPSRLKLVLNSWVVGLTGLTAEVLAVAERLGVEATAFFDTIQGGPLDAGYAHIKGAAMGRGDYTASFPLALAAKDAGLVLEHADDGAHPLRMLRALHEAFGEAITAGHGRDDMAALFEVLRK